MTQVNMFNNLAAVEAELTYLAPMVERPHMYTFDPPPGVPRTNIVPARHVVPIRNARPIASALSLDREGFSFMQQSSLVQDFYDDNEVRSIYYSEAERWLTAQTGADRVIVFDHTVRRRVPGAEDREHKLRQPVALVHVDFSDKSAPERARDLLPTEAGALQFGRRQIINLWRPIRGPLRDTPLAVCDARSVKSTDLVPMDLVYPRRSGEVYSVTYSPAHCWFYIPEMGADEVLLLKCYDSKTDGRARFTPHSAFTDPTTPPDAALRESIELRTLVLHTD